MQLFKIRAFHFITAFSILGFTQCNTSLPEDVENELANLPQEIDFNFDVKPILSDRCYSCHGPDQNTRKAELRLDTEEGAFSVLSSGNTAFHHGNISKSEAIARILSEDVQTVMPPPESKLSLSAKEKAILTKWVDQGAEWKKHWSFLPIENYELPNLEEREEVEMNPIDYFIRSKLKLKGLNPSPEADKERLLRRVTLDLTGLPPTIEEIDAFLEDDSPNAYEKVVDRLLSSKAYGERMAMEWMDVSRYADSHGFHADGLRRTWPWRDWVIEAFNENMPYDEFVTKQLAGDLLPDAKREDILATAFNRNHPMTAEGGAIDEEFRMEYVADRTNTVATITMGMTMECARCHDHKFDPLSQADYYKLSSFFNNVEELGLTGDDGDFGPLLMLSSESEEKTIDSLDAEIDKVLRQLGNLEKEPSAQAVSMLHKKGLLGHFPLDKLTSYQKEGKEVNTVDSNKKSTYVGNPELVEGKKGNALLFNDEWDEVFLEGGMFESYEPFSLSAWINPEKFEKGKLQTIIGNTGNKNTVWRGWDLILLDDGKLSLRLISSLPENYIQVNTKTQLPVDQWTHVGFSYDGSMSSEGVQLFIEGKPAEVSVASDNLYKSMVPMGPDHKPQKRNLKVGKSYRTFSGENGIYKGQIDDIYLYEKPLSSLEMYKLFGEGEEPISASAIREHSFMSTTEYNTAQEKLYRLRRQKLSVVDSIPEIMVMKEKEKLRKTFILGRGQYDVPLSEVSPGMPEKILPYSENLPPNRLGLANWIFDDKNPLTARVTVNRYWKNIFGRGIVKTINDFGNQGDFPSHPKLLDWLAYNFIENNWDLKWLQKLLVMSATYRQNSAITQESKAKDPENIYFSRGPSYRLQAEMIRDNALAASGLLVRKVGGKSVKPYQPEGLWIEKGNFSHDLLRYVQDKGDALYRRSLYTFIRRTSPPPFMTTFDAPSREVCTVERERTNTPLQALVLLNDPQFVEAARALAVNMEYAGGENLEEKFNYAFRRSTGRRLKEEETAVFKQLYQGQKQFFSKDTEAVQELLSVGEFKSDKQEETPHFAALTVVANTILNHDESYSKR